MNSKTSGTHRIVIRGNEATGTYDVLTNGCSYRIHRGLPDPYAARQCADEIRRQFRRLGQRATIEHDGEPQQFSDASSSNKKLK